MSHIRTTLLRVRDSFWFWPAALGIVAITLAQVLVTVDRSARDAGTVIPFLDALSASGGRSVLTTVGTSMLTVAGTSFSIVISVLATTTSTYGPRLVRNFMADRANQLVLAAFTSTFLYCLVALRTVHTQVDDTQAFVPVIAVHVAVLLGILDAGVLVFFIHHVATSVQITTLQGRVRAELDAALAVAYPSDPAEDVSVDPVEGTPAGGSPDGAAPDDGTAPWHPIDAEEDGSVEDVAWATLRDLAAASDVVIRVVAMPGVHVIRGEPLVEVSGVGPDGPEADLRRRVRTQFTLGGQRTPYQDVRFALQQLVESAVRGLASGSNDPYTAVSALDLAAAALAPVLRDRHPITAHLDDDGRPVVLPQWPDPVELVGSVVDDALVYGSEHPLVLTATRRFVDRTTRSAAPRYRADLDALHARVDAAVTTDRSVRGAAERHAAT